MRYKRGPIQSYQTRRLGSGDRLLPTGTRHHATTEQQETDCGHGHPERCAPRVRKNRVSGRSRRDRWSRLLRRQLEGDGRTDALAFASIKHTILVFVVPLDPVRALGSDDDGRSAALVRHGGRCKLVRLSVMDDHLAPRLRAGECLGLDLASCDGIESHLSVLDYLEPDRSRALGVVQRRSARPVTQHLDRSRGVDDDHRRAQLAALRHLAVVVDRRTVVEDDLVLDDGGDQVALLVDLPRQDVGVHLVLPLGVVRATGVLERRLREVDLGRRLLGLRAFLLGRVAGLSLDDLPLARLTLDPLVLRLVERPVGRPLVERDRHRLEVAVRSSPLVLLLDDELRLRRFGRYAPELHFLRVRQGANKVPVTPLGDRLRLDPRSLCVVQDPVDGLGTLAGFDTIFTRLALIAELLHDRLGLRGRLRWCVVTDADGLLPAFTEVLRVLRELYPRDAERHLEPECLPRDEALTDVLSGRVAVANALRIGAIDALALEVEIFPRRTGGLDVDVTVVTEGVSSWQLDSIFRDRVWRRRIRSSRVGYRPQGHDSQT